MHFSQVFFFTLVSARGFDDTSAQNLSIDNILPQASSIDDNLGHHQDDDSFSQSSLPQVTSFFDNNIYQTNSLPRTYSVEDRTRINSIDSSANSFYINSIISFFMIVMNL